MKDPDYAAKYPRHSGNVLKMAKQAVDARHLAQRKGSYLGGTFEPEANAIGGEIGYSYYLEPWLEQQIALAGLYSDDLHDAYIGGKLGYRVQSPSRVAPFVGLGGFAGLFHKGTPYDTLYVVGAAVSDDPDYHYDHDPGDDGLHPMLAVYPEVGVHFWLNEKFRLTASGSYHISTEGRKFDYYLFNFGISRMTVPDRTADPAPDAVDHQRPVTPAADEVPRYDESNARTPMPVFD